MNTIFSRSRCQYILRECRTPCPNGVPHLSQPRGRRRRSFLTSGTCGVPTHVMKSSPRTMAVLSWNIHRFNSLPPHPLHCSTHSQQTAAHNITWVSSFIIMTPPGQRCQDCASEPVQEVVQNLLANATSSKTRRESESLFLFVRIENAFQLGYLYMSHITTFSKLGGHP